MTAAERWASELASWAIPDHIMAQAPESPWRFSPATFRPPPTDGPLPDTPSRRRAMEAIPARGSVLDVGCGGGAAGLALAPPAAHVTGFDQSQELLDVFTERAAEMGIGYQAVQGSWPEDGGLVEPADVVVCHHVAYNVPGLGAFATELTSHARVRVVMELTDRHPRSGSDHLWRHFWGIGRPSGPTGDDAVAALVEAGISPVVERSPRRWRGPVDREARVASLRRTLCLSADRDPEIDALLDADEPRPPGEVLTLWWPGTGPRQS